MVQRSFWLSKIEEAWKRRNVVWLSGVRRVGKTMLCQSLPDIEYFDCELPRVRRLMDDPQAFLEDVRGCRVVLDETHRLENPSELLKIASDHYPDLQILATGSSTLGASTKFQDTLAGRKAELWLTPMISADVEAFGQQDLGHRFLHGGLPPFFLASELPERDFQEWMDAYWAKDIAELFRLERRHSFQRFAELLMAQSGGLFEATRFAHPCEVSRTTISNYLSVLEATFVVHVIRPFSSHRPTEIVSAPKVYGFDTGFVCYHRGWSELRQEDMGLLWEHFVLNEVMGHLQSREVRYWRDKRNHEVDFVLVRRREVPLAIECKWSVETFAPRALLAFRRQYPQGKNAVVASDVDRAFTRNYNGVQVRFVSLGELIAGPHHQDVPTLLEILRPHFAVRLESIIGAGAPKSRFPDDKGMGGHAGRGETSLLWAVEPACVDTSRIPAPDVPGPHFAMGDYAAESDRRVGEQMVADLVQLLGAKAKALLEDYAKLHPKHNPLTFDQVEALWEQEVRPRLKDFASMQSGKESPPEDSRWYANWRVPHRG